MIGTKLVLATIICSCFSPYCPLSRLKATALPEGEPRAGANLKQFDKLELEDALWQLASKHPWDPGGISRVFAILKDVLLWCRELYPDG